MTANASLGLGVALLTLAAPPLILCAFRLAVMLLCACCGVPVDGRVVTSQTNVRDAMLACFRPRKMLAKRGSKRGSREMWVAYRPVARPWAMTTVEVGAHHVVRSGQRCRYGYSPAAGVVAGAATSNGLNVLLVARGA